jgi:hypothetical protein
MKKLLKITLSILAILPIASVAFAAESRLLELEGETDTDSLRNEIRSSRQMLFADGAAITSIEDARERFMSQTDNMNAESEFQKTIEFLDSQGLISVNEKEILSYGPSHY